MNFITKNLGWLLLLLFFLFMLFVISSNKDGGNTQISSSTGEIQIEAKKGDLDDLVKMIDETSDDVIISDEIIEEKIEKKGGFFSWFSKDDSIEDIIIEEEVEKNIEKEVKEEDIVINKEGSGDKEEKGFFKKIFGKDNIQEVEEEIKGSLVKTSGTDIATAETKAETKALIQKYAPEMLAKVTYPGTKLESQIGKSFEIGVHSLKLNNAYFTETIGYMLKGDAVKQLTKENSRGCFQVEVTQSKNNTGKIGYVCKKYLQEKSVNTVIEENIILEEVKEEVIQETNIGDFITIENTSATLGDDIELVQGDIIDQMTDYDAEGCFIAHVYESSISHLSTGNTGKICLNEIR